MLEWKIYIDVSCAFCLITLLVTLQEQPSLPSPRLVKILTCEFMNENLCNIKYEDLARSKSEALVNVYILLDQNIKSCTAQRRRQRKRPKQSVGLTSKKKKVGTCSTLFCTFLCRCFARLQRETSRNFLVTRFMEEMLYVSLFLFFSLPLIFTLMAGR